MLQNKRDQCKDGLSRAVGILHGLGWDDVGLPPDLVLGFLWSELGWFSVLLNPL